MLDALLQRRPTYVGLVRVRLLYEQRSRFSRDHKRPEIVLGSNKHFNLDQACSYARSRESDGFNFANWACGYTTATGRLGFYVYGVRDAIRRRLFLSRLWWFMSLNPNVTCTPRVALETTRKYLFLGLLASIFFLGLFRRMS